MFLGKAAKRSISSDPAGYYRGGGGQLNLTSLFYKVTSSYFFLNYKLSKALPAESSVKFDLIKELKK